MSEELIKIEHGVRPRRHRGKETDPRQEIKSKFIDALCIEIEKSESACDFSKANDTPLEKEQAESIVQQIQEIETESDLEILNYEILPEVVSYFRRYETDAVIELLKNVQPKDYFLESGDYFSEKVRKAKEKEKKIKFQILYEPMGSLPCPNCKQNTLLINSNQTTRGDEGTTIYRNCNNCGFNDTQK